MKESEFHYRTGADYTTDREFRIMPDGRAHRRKRRHRQRRRLAAGLHRCPAPGRSVRGGAESSTGIGLAIVRRIAESCGGRAWIEETPGGGCNILSGLPVEEAS
ncbi:ATP-binding protein [Propionivibrio sp.]|uniref:ATP-binding protein n=1 Tax=Propionivibrio sp. TaxID=2212460 RepID=UPI003BF1E274